jgi:hypothetical protein
VNVGMRRPKITTVIVSGVKGVVQVGMGMGTRIVQGLKHQGVEEKSTG